MYYISRFSNHGLKSSNYNLPNQTEFDDIFLNFIKTHCSYNEKINLFLIIDDIGEDSCYKTEENVLYIERLNNSLEKFNISYVFVTNIRNNKFNLPIKNVCYVKGQSLHLYNAQFIKNNNINESWNYTSDKALFIPGKINRYNRCVLMYELYKNNFLNNLSWSFVVSPKIKDAVKNNYFNHLTNEEFEHFIHTVSKTLDISVIDSDFYYDDYICRQYPYDAQIYKDTSFSIISETYYDWGRTPTITEKTYRTIVNKHPFIISGAPGTLDELESYGYKTFKEYFLLDHDKITNEKERLQAVIKNTMYFHQNLNKNIEQIKIDVEYNYKLFISLTENEISNLEKTFPKDSYPQCSKKWYDYLGYHYIS